MKRIVNLQPNIISFFICIFTYPFFYATAQHPTIQWGEMQKIAKKARELTIVHTDETGIYMVEGHYRLSSFYLVGGSYSHTQNLLKFDKQFNLIYEVSLEELLGNYIFKDFYALGEDLYVFGNKYDKETFQFSIFASKINKETGEKAGQLKEIAGIQLAGKKSALTYEVNAALDQLSFLIMLQLDEENTKTQFIAGVSPDIKKTKFKQLVLPEEEKYELTQVQNLKQNAILMVANQYTLEDVGKKMPVRVKKGVAVDIYGENGRKIRSLPSVVQDKYILEAQLLEVNKKFYLTGSYCNTSQTDELHGFFRASIDTSLSAYTNITIVTVTQAMLGPAYLKEMEAAKTRKEKRKDDDKEDDGLRRGFRILKILNNEDGGFTLIAERSWIEKSVYSKFGETPTGAPVITKTETITSHVYGEIILIKSSIDGKIQWTNILPKRQAQHYTTYEYPRGGIFIAFGVKYNNKSLWPMYTSAAVFQKEHHAYLVFNDHPANGGVLKTGDKMTACDNMQKSNGFIVDCDLATGNLKRFLLSDEKKDPTMMPRFGFMMESTLVIPAMKVNGLGAGKGEIRLGALSY